MMRASPADLRKAIEAANVMLRAGILFVPVPALSHEDFARLQAEAVGRLDQMAEELEEEELGQ